MKNIKRSTDRYVIYGRAEAPDICQIPGILADISKAGCKLRFPLPLSIDMDYDYTVRITFQKVHGQFLLYLYVILSGLNRKMVQLNSVVPSCALRILHSFLNM